MLFQKVQQIYPSNKYDFFPVCSLLTNRKTLYNSKIVQKIDPPFEPITALFTITGLRPKGLKCSSLAFQINDTKHPFIQTNKHFKAHLYCLFALFNCLFALFTPKLF